MNGGKEGATSAHDGAGARGLINTATVGQILFSERHAMGQSLVARGAFATRIEKDPGNYLALFKPAAAGSGCAL